jgi:putative PEP-CTERM system TPR-repeat lipoprotein
MAKPPSTSLPVRLLMAAALLAGLGIGEANAQALERARAAQARGDLRTAQIEYRNAIRADPNNAAARFAFAALSMEMGDPDTAEREARAAMERGFDQATATALLMRTYLARGRARDMLRDFPQVDAPPAVAGQIATLRALGELSVGQREPARQAAQAAVRFAPNLPEAHLAMASVALADGNRAEAEAGVDRALALDANHAEALLRKASFQAESGNQPAAVETLGRLIARAPGNVPARLLRGELLIRAGQEAAARQDIDQALRVSPNNPAAIYLQALAQIRQQDWRGADETLQRIAGALPNIGDGLLMLATVKRALNQPAQAEDAAQRYVARRPDDPRGAKVLATILMEMNRPDTAAGVLQRQVQRGNPDVETLDMLGRAQVAAGRPREAVAAFGRAAEMAPQDAGLRARLAAARMASGDSRGTTQAAEESLRLTPEQSGARELMAIAALARGDVTGAQAEFERLSPQQRQGEAARTLGGLLQLARFDIAGARRTFDETLRAYPESVGARLGLARVATAQGDPGEAERLLGEVLRRVPSHPEALGRLLATVTSGGPRSASALAIIQAVQSAHPNDVQLTLAAAAAFAAAGQPDRALAILDTQDHRRAGQGPALPMARSQAFAQLSRWPEAEQAARAALAEDASYLPARRQIAALMVRNGDVRGAEAVLQEGLRTMPGNAGLQQLLVGLVREHQGLDAALQLADRMAGTVVMQPASLSLRGDLLAAANRPADAARAYQAAWQTAPSSDLAQRQAAAWRAAGNDEAAMQALNAWLARSPEDPGALNLAAQFDILAGRNADAVRRLGVVVSRAPDNAVALNNLAWLTQAEGRPDELARAKAMAERAYFMMPSPETADTFGWILAQTGEVERALILLRQAASSSRGPGRTADPGKVFRYAHTLSAAGQKAEALRVLEPALAADDAFPERAAAERLLAELRRG